MSHDRLKQLEARRILVVCYGNVCRSPLAAELLRRELGGFAEVRSGGLGTADGRRVPPGYGAMCAAAGVDLQGHRSVRVSRPDLDWADVVVLMDRHNWQSLAELGADEERLLWLGSFDGKSVEIRDPFGRNDGTIADTISRIRASTSRLAKLMRECHSSAPRLTRDFQ